MNVEFSKSVKNQQYKYNFIKGHVLLIDKFVHFIEIYMNDNSTRKYTCTSYVN